MSTHPPDNKPKNDDKRKNSDFSITDRRMVVILLIVFVQIVGASMVLPILPLYAKREFGMSDATVTLLITIFFAAQFVAGPFIGKLSDRFGRVPVLIVSQIGTVLSFVALGMAQTVFMLFAARMVDGITGGNIIVAQAYITDIAPRNKRTEALGYLFAAFGVGFIIGPAVGGILASQFGYTTPYFFAAFAAAVVVLLTWFFLDETVSEEQRAANRQRTETDLSPRKILANLPLVGILGIGFGAQFAFSMLQATFSLFGEAVIFAGSPPGRAELGVGLLLATAGIGQLITQTLLLRRFINWFGESPLVVIGGALRGVSFIAIIIQPTPLFAVIGLLLFSVGSGLQRPALQSLVTSTVNDDERGAVLGIYQSATSLSIIVGSAIAGTLFAITPQTPYLVGGALYGVMLIPGLFLVRWARAQDFDSDDLKPVPAGD